MMLVVTRAKGESCARGACAMSCRVNYVLGCSVVVESQVVNNGLMQHASQISNQIIRRAAFSELPPASRRRRQRSLSSRAH